MAKWVHPDEMDNGLSAIKTNANAQWLLKAYAAGDSYATCTGNMIAEVAMTSGDYTLADGASSSRTLTTAAGKTDSGATPNLHIAFVDTVNSKVLWVTDETSDQVVTLGNPVTFPSVVLTRSQPT